MNDQTQDRFAKMFLKNMIEFMNNNSDEFGLNNIISPVSGNSFLTEINKLSEVVSSDIPIEEGLKSLIKLDNVITNNEITNNEITNNEITDNVITNNEITDKETNISSESTLLVKEDDEAWIVNNIKILKDPRCCHNKWERLDVCRHNVVDTVTNIGTCLKGNEICYFLIKHNFSISHFDRYKSDYEYYRKRFDPTPEDIIQREVEKAIKEEQEKKLAEERKKMDEITNKYKASSRLDKLKEKNNIK
jgi:hypothetical protein